jgi:AcrR family transcriptional regulator
MNFTVFDILTFFDILSIIPAARSGTKVTARQARLAAESETSPGALAQRAAQPMAQPREAVILDAAFRAFTQYGFARTTMDDIAREADVSRPALYLHFRNKKEIYRAFATAMTTAMTRDLALMLEKQGAPADILWQAFDAAVIGPMAAFIATKHGSELLDMKNDLAADIMEAMRMREHEALAAYFVRLGRDGGSAGRLADLLIDALEGAKMRMRDIDGFRDSVRSAVQLVASLAESPR